MWPRVSIGAFFEFERHWHELVDTGDASAQTHGAGVGVQLLQRGALQGNGDGGGGGGWEGLGGVG